MGSLTLSEESAQAPSSERFHTTNSASWGGGLGEGTPSPNYYNFSQEKYCAVGTCVSVTHAPPSRLRLLGARTRMRSRRGRSPRLEASSALTKGDYRT